MRHPWATGDLATAMNALALVFSPEFVETPDFQARMAALLPAFPHTEAGMHAVVEEWEADLAHDTRARLGAIAAPTLVVAGEHDLMTPPRHARAVGAPSPVPSWSCSHALGRATPSALSGRRSLCRWSCSFRALHDRFSGPSRDSQLGTEQGSRARVSHHASLTRSLPRDWASGTSCRGIHALCRSHGFEGSCGPLSCDPVAGLPPISSSVSATPWQAPSLSAAVRLFRHQDSAFLGLPRSQP